MKLFALPTALAILLLGLGSARADDQADLQAGKILVSSGMGSEVKPGRASAVVDAPVKVVEKILLGFEHYQDFVPRITDSRKVKDNRYVLHAEFPWPVSKAWAYIRSSYQKSGSIRFVRWTMLNGTLKRFEGMAWIQPWGKSRSLLTYQMLVVPKTLAPDGRITRGLRNAVKGMVKAVRKRVAQVQKQVSGVKLAAQ
jgi:hypothetical protein